MRATEIVEALSRRHPEEDGEWTFLVELPLPPTADRRVDALAVRAWQGGIGCRRVAYEIKTTVADYRSEIAKPAKRQRALGISHEFYFAVPEELGTKILLVERTLPPEAGLIVVDGEGNSRRVKHAPRRIVPPLSDADVAWILRHRATPPALRSALADRETARHAIETAEGRLRGSERARERLVQRLAELAGGTVDVGSVWRARDRGMYRGRVSVLAILETTRRVRVRFLDGIGGWEDDLPIGTLLAEFTLALIPDAEEVLAHRAADRHAAVEELGRREAHRTGIGATASGQDPPIEWTP